MDPLTGRVTREGCEWLSSGTGFRPSPNAFSSCTSAACFPHPLWEASWGPRLFRPSSLMLPVGEPFPVPPGQGLTTASLHACRPPGRRCMPFTSESSVQTARLMNEGAGRGRGAGQGDNVGRRLPKEPFSDSADIFFLDILTV